MFTCFSYATSYISMLLLFFMKHFVSKIFLLLSVNGLFEILTQNAAFRELMEIIFRIIK